jgi:triosephosphate isomerase
MARRKMIAGNWKMHKTVEESVHLAQALVRGAGAEAEVLLAPTALALSRVAEVIKGSPLLLAGQNLYWQDNGAYTGEISAPLLKAAGATHVLVGHSERRQLFGETEKTANLRLRAALKHELTPVLCLGETLEEREQEQTEDVLTSQLAGALAGFTRNLAARVIIAYEPVWAIGSGKTASDAQANQAHGFIRSWLAGRFGAALAEAAVILYGGSVKPAGAASLLAQSEVDGALVGGASLQAEDFLAIIRAAGNAPAA